MPKITGIKSNMGKLGIGGIPCTVQPWAVWFCGNIIFFAATTLKAEEALAKRKQYGIKGGR